MARVVVGFAINIALMFLSQSVLGVAIGGLGQLLHS